jgi:superfamily II DNA or RNA helicase
MGDFTVTHNTCTAISIAEGFKEYLSDVSRKILVLVKNDNIKKNFVDELYKTNCTHNEYFDDSLREEYATAKGAQKDEIVNRVIRRINKVYQFMTYGTFANSVFGIKQYKDYLTTSGVERKTIGRKEPTLTDLNNTVIIVDEVHNVTNNVYYKALMNILQRSFNYRLVLLTATPMYDNMTEIFEISNLLNANNPELILPIGTALFNPFKNGGPILIKEPADNIGLLNTNRMYLTEHGENLLKRSLYGKISYLPSDRGEYPVKIDMGTPLLDLTGSTNIVRCEMSEYQTEVYLQALNIDKKLFSEFDLSETANNLESSSNENADSSSMYYNTSSAATLVYPDNLYGENGFKESFKPIKRGGYSINDINILTTELKKYSTKLHSILENVNTIISQPGLVFIYSNFVKYNGAELLRQLFLANGFKEYTNESSSVDQRTFVIFDAQFNSSQRKSILNVYNNPKNRNGTFIKIIVGSPVISEGITLKNTRQVHILEPCWNKSRINQIIGRAVRFRSHEALEPEFRNVSIFKYIAVPKNESVPSIDEQKYILSEYKDRSNKSVERILKTISIDCSLNVRYPGINGSEDCDYTDCDYKCEIAPRKDFVDKSTYNLFIDFFDKFDIEYNISVIKRLFTDYFVWSIEDIKHTIKSSISNPDAISDESIYFAIDSLVENKVSLNDQFNREGYLVRQGDFIVFNPMDKDIATSLFAKTLDFKQYVNKYTLEDFLKREHISIPQKQEIKVKASKIGVELPQKDLDFNQNIMQKHLVYGTYRAEGANGLFGPKDDFFRIVDLRNFKKEDLADNRKVPSGMRITSKKKHELRELITYFKIKTKDLERLKSTELSKIIENYFKEHNLILH